MTGYVIPQIGDFGVARGGGWPMWCVRLGTFSRYGHAAEVVEVDGVGEDGAPVVTVIEAAPGGVRRRVARTGEFRWSTGGPLDAVLTDEIRVALVRRAYSVTRTPYDWPSIVGFLARFVGAKVRGFAQDHPDEKLFCSELVVWNRREEARFRGIPELDMFPTVAPGSVSPGDLVDWCPRSPGGLP